MIEAHLYWCSTLDRWIYEEGKDAVNFMVLRLPHRVRVQGAWRRYCLCHIAKKQGMGRRSKEEVEKFGSEYYTVK